ncbi:hypothetical protein CBL_04507 [Carabus blaptoides fortunei]
MSGKFLLAFVAIVCFVQGYQARTVELEQRNVVDDIVNAIKDLVGKVQQAIDNIIGDIPELLEKLKNKIEEIVSQIDIGAIITSIQDKIDEILANAGIDVSEARSCIDAQKASVSALVQETQDKLLECRQHAADQADNLAKEVDELKAKTDALIEDIFTRVDKCIKDNGINIINTATCLGGQIKYLKETAGPLIAQLKETVVAAKDTAIQVPVDLAKCVHNVNTNIISTQKTIMDDFRTCINELDQPE